MKYEKKIGDVILLGSCLEKNFFEDNCFYLI